MSILFPRLLAVALLSINLSCSSNSGGPTSGNGKDDLVEKRSSDLDLKKIAFTIFIKDDGKNKDKVICNIELTDLNQADRYSPVKVTGSDRIECEGIMPSEIYYSDNSMFRGYSGSILKKKSNLYTVKLIRGERIIPIEVQMPFSEVDGFTIENMGQLSIKSVLKGSWHQTLLPQDKSSNMKRRVEILNYEPYYFGASFLYPDRENFEFSPLDSPLNGVWPKNFNIQFIIFSSDLLPENLSGSKNGELIKTVPVKIN